MAEAEKEVEEQTEAERKKKMRKVPRGTSTYQAAWIIDSEDEDEDSGDERSDNAMDQV